VLLKGPEGLDTKSPAGHEGVWSVPWYRLQGPSRSVHQQGRHIPEVEQVRGITDRNSVGSALIGIKRD
jgi:hypothetical protein